MTGLRTRLDLHCRLAAFVVVVVAVVVTIILLFLEIKVQLTLDLDEAIDMKLLNQEPNLKVVGLNLEPW